MADRDRGSTSWYKDVGKTVFRKKRGQEDLRQTTAVLAMMLVMLAVCSEAFAQGAAMVIRIPSAGSDGEGATVGLLQVLVILAILVLLALLAGFVAWRVRRTSRSK